MSRTAARLLVDCLAAQSVRHVFCVPGESYLAVLDALHDRADIATITCRHEAGATTMAEAVGKLTARPGVAMVTRGPGATHASVAIHTARQDSTPRVLFVGQVARTDMGREAFQELDYVQAFGPLAKWAVEINDADRVPEILSRAFATAMQGRPGPVVVALPEDMLADLTDARPCAKVEPARAGLDRETHSAIVAALQDAKSPVIILGGSGWRDAEIVALRPAVERAGLPVVLSFRRKDLLDNRSAAYVGDLGLGPNPKLLERVRAADLVLCIGARLGENPTQGYALFSRDDTAQRLIHVHPDPEEIGRVWPPRIGAVANPGAALTVLEALAPNAAWSSMRDAMRTELDVFGAPSETLGLNLGSIYDHLRRALPDEAIVCNGAGNYAAWLHRYFPCHGPRTQLAPTSGAMGYGFPAAIGAKIAFPEREVVAVAGDGCFLMTGQELATAAQYKAGVVAIVVDNGSYGTIRMHQDKHFPGRVQATDLNNPDFAAYAHAFGAWGRRVETEEEFPAALAEARAAAAEGAPALIHLLTDVRDIAPGRRLG
jgi:acetolactate synthase-1/2/3 large subunit